MAKIALFAMLALGLVLPGATPVAADGAKSALSIVWIEADGSESEPQPVTAAAVQAAFAKTRKRWASGAVVVEYRGAPKYVGLTKRSLEEWDRPATLIHFDWQDAARLECKDMPKREGAIVVATGNASGYAGWAMIYVGRENHVIAGALVCVDDANAGAFGEVMTHELGHALGFPHNNATNKAGEPLSIMHANAYLGTYRITARDRQTLRQFGYAEKRDGGGKHRVCQKKDKPKERRQCERRHD